jgi:hypothetical protein
MQANNLSKEQISNIRMELAGMHSLLAQNTNPSLRMNLFQIFSPLQAATHLLNQHHAYIDL